MENYKHTPGPWHYDVEHPEPGVAYGHVYSDDGLICETEADAEADKAPNARLISASPDLLEAAKKATSFLGEDFIDDPEDLYEAIQELQRAVEKAEGQL